MDRQIELIVKFAKDHKDELIKAWGRLDNDEQDRLKTSFGTAFTDAMCLMLPKMTQETKIDFLTLMSKLRGKG